MTINKLEKDETAWLTLQDSTVDKIMSFYSSMASWQPERPDKVIREINDVSGEQQIEEEVTKFGNCEKLKLIRKNLGMSQTEFSVKVGISDKTVRILEKDENAWSRLHKSTVDKIMSFYSSMTSGQPEEPQVEEEVIMEPTPVIKETKSDKIVDNVTKKDEKTLTLIEFAYEELTQAETHDDFVIAIQMLKKIVNKY